MTAVIVLFLLEYAILLMPGMTSGIPEVVSESLSALQMLVFGVLLLVVMLVLFNLFRFRKEPYTDLYVFLFVILFGILIVLEYFKMFYNNVWNYLQNF